MGEGAHIFEFNCENELNENKQKFSLLVGLEMCYSNMALALSHVRGGVEGFSFWSAHAGLIESAWLFFPAGGRLPGPAAVNRSL